MHLLNAVAVVRMATRCGPVPNLGAEIAFGTVSWFVYAATILPVVQKQHQLLVTLLLCNAAAMEALPLYLDKLFSQYLAIILSVTFVLFFGEVIPQAICTRYGLAVGSNFVWLVRILMFLCYPIAYPIGKILDCVLGHNEVLFRRAQLKALVSIHSREAGKGGDLTHDETTIISGALDLTEKTVEEAMTPIESTFSLDVNSKLDWEAMGKVLARGHSRVPVYSGNPKNVIGLLLVKSLLTVRAETETPVSEVSIRRIPRVPADMPLYDILNEFQKGSSHMAAVVKAKGKSKKPPSVVEERKSEDSAVNSETAPLLMKTDGKSDNVVVDIEKATLPASGDAVTNSVPHSSDDIEDAEVIGIITLEDVFEELLQEEIVDETDEYVDVHKRIRVAAAAAASSVARAPSIRREAKVNKDKRLRSRVRTFLAQEGIHKGALKSLYLTTRDKRFAEILQAFQSAEYNDYYDSLSFAALLLKKASWIEKYILNVQDGSERINGAGFKEAGCDETTSTFTRSYIQAAYNQHWSYGSGKEDNPPCDIPGFKNCKMKLLRHVSFVDYPGHEILMTRMLSGATIMDGALLLIAANESCPQPQTLEHLSAVDILKLQNLIILQNKVDLIKEGQARDQYKAIREFLKGTVAEGAPVVPVSSQLNYNIDAVCKYIGKIPIPKRDFVSPPHMVAVRSFDVNKPGCGIDDMKGGVVGGTITKGILKVNQMVELRPGIIDKDADGKTICKSIYSRIMSLFAEQNKLHFAVPGGLIGVGTSMDPALSGSDMLVGQVLGNVGTLPEVYIKLKIRKIKLLRRLVGVEKNDSGKQVSNLVKGEVLMLNILSMTTWAKIITVRKNCATLQLTAPACTGLDEKVVLSRRVGGHWRLIGWGEIEDGVALDVPTTPPDIFS
ncbi:hypothetical protein K7X08_025830 [Anisodus acutangulus]|uniref:protein-synthesizing GTPase n=1 Tax=Anisodus acutangulus TaxID=402998 RepID=A0A9Q1QX39_9SOLA|nr:hypothetical protein K7X08_025830 [Anisodus acutangulus]